MLKLVHELSYFTRKKSVKKLYLIRCFYGYNSWLVFRNSSVISKNCSFSTLVNKGKSYDNSNLKITRFSYKQRFCSTQLQRCLTFSWIELQMLLRCCLIHITIITLRHTLYLVYLNLGLYMLYPCDLFFHFQSHFHCHYSYNSIKTDTLAFSSFFRTCPIIFG